MSRPSTEELEAMDRAIKCRYPWLWIQFPTCKYGHWMGQLGMNPEPFVVVVNQPDRQFIRCVRCKREADQRSRRRRKTQ